MEKNLKFLISSSLVALCFLIPQKTQGMELVEKVYDPTVTYSSGLFDHHQEGSTFSTLPGRAQEAYNQRVLIYEKAPQELKWERILMQVIPGQDGRVRIQQTNRWPYNICTQISMMFNGQLAGGSGCLVGPHHVLTCGHNVYDSAEGWADEISVYPALDDNSMPFGEAKVVKVVTFDGWTSGGNPALDMALLVLNKSIGKYTGWGGLLSDDEMKLLQETVHITGYPGDKGLKQMWSMSHKIKEVRPEQFDYEIDTYPGQSGSPIWIKHYGLPMILGVHTLGANSINSGVRLSTQKFKGFVDAISKTYVLDDDEGKQGANIARAPAIPIPPVARGFEAIYQRFFNGVLVYRPHPGNDAGRVDMPIRDLANPLEGEFDLSRCGDTGNYLSISTGYRKVVNPANANKVEIWLAPKFLIDKELVTTAGHFKKISGTWAADAHVGIFWTWGGCTKLGWCDYLTSQNVENLSKIDLYENWKKSTGHSKPWIFGRMLHGIVTHPLDLCITKFQFSFK